MGAWIEIFHAETLYNAFRVAPLVGAWIEIAQMLEGELVLRVAPLVGAWIEICNEQYTVHEKARRSPRGSVD